LLWVSPPGDYAIVNSNHIPDGTRAAADTRLTEKLNKLKGYNGLDAQRCFGWDPKWPDRFGSTPRNQRRHSFQKVQSVRTQGPGGLGPLQMVNKVA
jgi:hypothetical protein